MTADSGTPEPGPEDGGGSRGAHCCKVRRTAVRFDLPDLLSTLAERRRSGVSFRTLAEYFNQQIVARAIDEADIGHGRTIHAALTGEDLAEEVYTVLRGSESTDVKRAEVRARLSDAGVDVETLESAFVSHVTLRSHLQDCVDVAPDEPLPPFDQTINTTQGARSRAVNVIQSTIDRAVTNGQLETRALDVDVSIQLTCQECGDTFYLSELLDKRRCSCATAQSPEE